MSKDEEAETVDPDAEYPLEVDGDEDWLEVLEEGEELKSGEASPKFSFQELKLTRQVFRIVISISFVHQ